mgnify:CR=1 FL=1
MTIINYILCIIELMIIPSLVGCSVCRLLDTKCTIAKCILEGYVGLWALCQIIAVPLILLKRSFLVFIVIYTTIVVILCTYAIYKKIYRELFVLMRSIMSIFSMAIMLIFILFVIVQAVRLQLTNADDARFVVNAVDIVRTNRLLLTDVNTGNVLTTWTGDLVKDVVSPWPVFCAYISKMTGVQVVTMMHTVLPIFLILVACCVYWLLAEEFFLEETVYKSMFVCFVLLIDIYGFYSIYGVETFLMTRIWQGKAVLASVGIPIMILAFSWIYKEEKNAYINLLITVFGVSLLSSMSFILSTIMILAYGTVYAVIKKNIKTSILIWLTSLINIGYLGIAWIIDRG